MYCKTFFWQKGRQCYEGGRHWGKKEWVITLGEKMDDYFDIITGSEKHLDEGISVGNKQGLQTQRTFGK